MSGDAVLELLSLDKFKESVRVDTNHCLDYLSKKSVSEKEVILTVHLPYLCLREWCDARQKALERNIHCTFVQIFNAFVYHKTGMKVKDDCKRVEGRLRRICSEVRQKFVGKSGTTYIKLCQKEIQMALQLEELVTLSELENELDKQKSSNDELLHEKEILQQRCEALFCDLIEVEDAAIKVDTDMHELSKTNHNLHNYIEGLGQELNFNNSGRKLSDVGERHQRRKLRQLKTKVEKALWFARSFGLDLQSVVFTDEQKGNRTLCYSEKVQTAYKDLSEVDQQKVKNVLFILDKFCISDAAYHELTMVCGDDLPRSYLIKQCKNQLNSLCHISRTPGLAQGAQVDFMSELESVIESQIQQNVLDVSDPQFQLHVKLSGDGAKMTRLTNFVVISFSILNSQKDVMSSKGNHTVAVIKGQESYELLSSSCSKVFEQVNKLVSTQKITINGTDIPVNVYLGGDYKFLLLILGMKSATSDYACIWCKIHKSNRHDVTKPKYFYCGELARTINDIKESAEKGKSSCAHQPLLNIPLSNVVLDELHLMLRVTDKLTKNLVTNAIEWDRKENINKRPMDRSDIHLQSLVKTICSCGVSFNVWEKMDGDGKGSGVHDFTSLMGSDKKLLLQNLPMKLAGIIKDDNASEKIIRLWKEFNDLYNLMRTQSPSERQIADYFTKATIWVTVFTSLGGLSLGYEKARVTPYMHAMVYHVPQFMDMHGGIKKFTGQGVEKLNDDCRRIHLRRSNKWDAPKDVLLVGKRLENLSQLERVRSNYQKQNDNYWISGIKETRAKRERISAECAEEERECESDKVESLGVNEVKARLRDLGVKTKYRSAKKIKKLLIDTLRDKQNLLPVA